MSYRSRRRKNRAFGNIYFWIGTLVTSITLVVIILTFVGERTRVHGESMMNTLFNGDSLVIDKISYDFKNPKRFDIVVFKSPENSKMLLVKRIIGLPGETVTITNGKVYINNQEIAVDYSKDGVTMPVELEGPVTLASGQFFVLGDNRNNSKDSRFGAIGPITKKIIVGRAVMRVYPFNRIGLLR